VIVRPASDRIHLITQPDHAHLARRIMEHSVALASRPRRDSILHAIGEHDNGWAEADAVPIVDPESGNVMDFVNAPLSVRHGVWPRGIARLADDPWAAALIAQHVLTVYDRYRSDNEWTAFFGEMEAARASMLSAAAMPLAELQDDYVFVRLGDLISLTFCTGWTDVQRFGASTIHLSGRRIVVTPDPFDEATIPIAIAARAVRNPPYRSNEDLRDACREATPITLRGEVAGAG
jgi:hypothetical protein